MRRAASKWASAASHLLWRRSRMPLFSCTLALWGHTCSATASAAPRNQLRAWRRGIGKQCSTVSPGRPGAPVLPPGRGPPHLPSQSCAGRSLRTAPPPGLQRQSALPVASASCPARPTNRALVHSATRTSFLSSAGTPAPSNSLQGLPSSPLPSAWVQVQASPAG